MAGLGVHESIQYIAVSAEDADEEEFMFKYMTNMVFGQSYELAVVITNGVIKCYVDDALLVEYDGGEGLAGTSCSIGAWSDTNNAVVEAYVDNVYVLRELWDLSEVVEGIEISAGYEDGVLGILD